MPPAVIARLPSTVSRTNLLSRYKHELSQAADISQPYLAQLENGQREGSVSVYARLAKLLHVRIDDLVAEVSAEANGLV